MSFQWINDVTSLSSEILYLSFCHFLCLPLSPSLVLNFSVPLFVIFSPCFSISFFLEPSLNFSLNLWLHLILSLLHSFWFCLALVLYVSIPPPLSLSVSHVFLSLCLSLSEFSSLSAISVSLIFSPFRSFFWFHSFFSHQSLFLSLSYIILIYEPLSLSLRVGLCVSFSASLFFCPYFYLSPIPFYALLADTIQFTSIQSPPSIQHNPITLNFRINCSFSNSLAVVPYVYLSSSLSSRSLLHSVFPHSLLSLTFSLSPSVFLIHSFSVTSTTIYIYYNPTSISHHRFNTFSRRLIPFPTFSLSLSLSSLFLSPTFSL